MVKACNKPLIFKITRQIFDQSDLRIAKIVAKDYKKGFLFSKLQIGVT